MPLQETSGNATADAYGGGAAAAVNYIEDVFSTYLYTGNGSTQTITNNIDLAGKGGLLWIKSRTNPTNGTYHFLYDNVRGQSSGYYNSLASNTYDSSNIGGSYPGSYYGGVNSFNADGFTLATPGNGFYFTNSTSGTYASWTFRKQPKFFDIVTWTGNGGTSGRTITHNLGSVPGCIIVKNTTSAEDWYVYPASLGNTGTKQYFLILNSTAAQDTGGNGIEKSSNWTSTQFAIASGSSALNGSGQTYVAYLFASNAGGFGLTGTDNVISCGSVTAGASNVSVNLGYEPQWILIKDASSATNWQIADTMRGATTDGTVTRLFTNLSNAESVSTGNIAITSTGFVLPTGIYPNGDSVIYIAIRRGPMKVPTLGTSVFQPIQYVSDNTNNRLITTGIVTDAVFSRYKDAITSRGTTVGTRLTGDGFLGTTSTAAENTGADAFSTPTVGYGNGFSTMTGFGVGTNATALLNFGTIYNAIAYAFKRAPSFFDEVCYTGTGTLGQTYNHNLGVAPELMIVKNRTTGGRIWAVYSNAIGATQYLRLDDTAPQSGVENRMWNSTSPTSTVFTVGDYGDVNTSSNNYVAYLFATCAGVSKVGSYTGTGATQTISCGFTGGARFVLIKRTDTTGDWYVWDTARGMVSGTDPSLLLNSTAAEVNANSVYTATGGFQIVSTAAGINASGGSYIFLAVA